MRAEEFITEITAGTIQVGEWTILVSDHLYDQADKRKIDYATVDVAAKKTPGITGDLAKLDVNSKLWAYDEETNISIGLRKRSGKTALLGTVVPGQAWDSDVVRVNLPQNQLLSAVKGSVVEVGKSIGRISPSVKPVTPPTVKPAFRAPGHMPDRANDHDPHKDLKIKLLKIVPDMLK